MTNIIQGGWVPDGCGHYQGPIDHALTQEYSTLWVEQEASNTLPDGAIVHAQLVVDGRVLATSYVGVPMTPTKPQAIAASRFRFPPINLMPQHYGVTYVVKVGEQWFPVRIDPPETC